MAYSDFDMKMMALGEVAAQVIGVIAAVGVWVCLDDAPSIVKVPLALIALFVVACILLGFVHLGYKPESDVE